MVEINNHQRKIQDNSPFIIFDHCFEDDILNDTVSQEEKEFMKRKKNSVQKDQSCAGAPRSKLRGIRLKIKKVS